MNKKLKVCMVAPVPPPYGGIANWYSLLSRYTTEERLNIDYITINIAPKNRTTDGRTLFDRVFVSGIEMLKKKKELKRLISQDKPDVIHMTTSGQLAIIRDILLLSYAKRKQIPTIYHIRFGRIESICRKNTIEWRLIKHAVALASITVAIDKVTEKTLKEKCRESRIIYIPNPFDIKTISTINLDQEREPNIVFIGWVVKTKGVEELLTAWDEVCGLFPKYTLSIIGPGTEDYINSLKRNYKCERVIFVGELNHEETLREIAKAELFILPSYTEGFPNAVLEAMAVKTPIIATRVGAIPDMLSDQCGILIDPCSSEQVVEALKKSLGIECDCKTYAENAYEKLCNEYSISKVINSYINLWNCKENYK